MSKIPPDDFMALVRLTRRMEEMPLEAIAGANDRLKRHREQEREQAWQQIVSGQATTIKWQSPIAILDLDEPAFREALKDTSNDLAAQVDRVERFVARWLEVGELPAPYYADRIAVILRKAKDFEMEQRFLAAYLKLFWTPLRGTADQKIVDRAKKIGIPTPDDLELTISETVARPDGSTFVNFAFSCKSCRGHILTIPDDPDEDGPVSCKACGLGFGGFGNLKTMMAHVANSTPPIATTALAG